MDDCGFSEIECKILLNQIERRAKYRKEFLKLRTDPFKHAQEAGHVVSKIGQNMFNIINSTLIKTIVVCNHF